MTVPYHLLINLICWTLFSYIYAKKKGDAIYSFKEAMHLGLLWLVVAMVVDFIGFVLIKSPVSLTPHEFYIDYQPWISITYFIVLISPAISYSLLGIKK